jgi:HlyD family secretion protein
MIKSSLPFKLHWKHAAIALALLAAAYFAMTKWLGPQVVVETVARRDFIQTVVASGRVESPHRVDIGSQITATVVRVPVNEGEDVTAGTLLLALSDTELQATQRQADMAVVQAQGKLRQVQEVQGPLAEQTLRQARASLDNANASYRRNQELFHQGFIGQAALDDSRKAAELADAQLRSAQKQLDTTSTTGSDYALAVSALDGVRAAATAAHARAQYALVRAPSDGTLIGRNVEVGDVVQPGKVLMTLSPKGKTQVVVAIDEKNLHFLHLGQKALVSADAYPQQHFNAELVYINPAVNPQTGAVDVKLDVPQPPEVLRQDMTVSVDLEVARRPKALMLPLSVVRDAESAAPWVLRVQGGRAVKVLVQVGLRSNGLLEALHGVEEGDWLVSGTPNVQPGDRVRVLAAAH